MNHHSRSYRIAALLALVVMLASALRLPAASPRALAAAAAPEAAPVLDSTTAGSVAAAPFASANAMAAAAASTSWVFQGPAPQLNGQQVLINDTTNNAVAGAVNAIAPSPTNPDLVYIGGTGGGVWKTTNATAASPTWTPLTDNLPSQSIGAIALDPLDSTSQTLLVGTGRFGGLGGLGDDTVGLYYTADGGATWSRSTDTQLSAANISAVAARGSIMLAASDKGLFRSTGGLAGPWTKIAIAGVAANAAAWDLAGDPRDPTILYTTFTGATGGIFRTTDAGANWTNVTNGIPVTTATSTGFGISSLTNRFVVSVYNDGTTSAVTVMLNGTSGNTTTGTFAKAIYRSVNGGAFTPLDLPAGDYGSSGSGVRAIGVAADKTNPNLAYIIGYGVLGSSPFRTIVYRLDASQPSGSQATLLSTQLTGTTGNYGAPHVDVNYIAPDATGGLWMGTHGGLFRLPAAAGAASATNVWVSKNGNLSVLEMHDIAYDHVSHVLLGSMQDNGEAFQSAPGSTTWTMAPNGSGDGGDVTVVDLGNGTSARYASNQSLGGLRRYVYNASNALVSNTAVSTSVITDVQFLTPLAVNAVDPQRLLLGGGGRVYESLNQGGTIAALPQPLGVNSVTIYSNYKGPIAYGGRLGGTANPDVLYIGNGSKIYARTTAGGTLDATAALPAGATNLQGIVLNPNDDTNVFAVDNTHVYASSDGGAHWSDITGSLVTSGLSSIQFTSLAYVSGASPYLAVGTRSGVFASLVSNLGTWVKLGSGLPDAVVFDLAYDSVDDVLAIGTMGRGAWTLPTASAAFVPSSVAPILAMINAPTTANEGTPTTYTFTVNDPGDRFTITGGAPTITGGSLVAGSLVPTVSGGSFQVIFPDGPATASVSLQVTDSTGLTSSEVKTSVTVANVAPTVAILGAPTSGSPGTTINLTGSVSDPSPVDQAGVFVYDWLVQKTVGATTTNFATGNAASFSYTPDVAGTYKVFFRAKDKDGLFSGYAAKTITAASPDLTEDNVSLTVGEGMAAFNSGTFQNVNGNPVTLSASVGTLTYQISTLVTNGEFSSGGTGWTATGSVGYGNIPEFGGDVAVFNGGGQPVDGVLSQQVSTVAGQSYTFDYAVARLGGASGTPQLLAEVIDANTNAVITSRLSAGTDTPAEWVPYSLSFTAPGSVIIRFTDQTTNGGFDLDVVLDHVSVSIVPAVPTLSGTWSWSYNTDDGPAQSQNVTITAVDDVNGEVTNISFPLNVLNAAPTAVFSLSSQAFEGNGAGVSFSGQSDPSAADTTAGFHYAYDFNNDGVFEIGDGTYAGSGTNATPSVPASFLADGPGTRVVRGRIIDKDGGYTDYTGSITIRNNRPTASASGPADALVGQVATFVVSANDPSAADQAAGFAYSIDWGDGSTGTIARSEGNGNATARHAYAATGSYSVQVRATDKDGGTSAPASAAIQVNTLDSSSLQTLIASTPTVYLQPASDAALHAEVTAINGLSAPATPAGITIVLGNGPYTGITLSPPDRISLDVAGNHTSDAAGTQITGASPAVTVTSGDVFVQGEGLTTATDSPTVLVTGGHLTMSQNEIQESTGANNVAVALTGGELTLGLDMLLNINGQGGFYSTYDPDAIGFPDGVDIDLVPNTYEVNGTHLTATHGSATDLASSANPSTSGQAVTFTAGVDAEAGENGPATGTVTFYDGATVLGTGTLSPVGGDTFTASFSTSALSVGSHTITAVYGGNAVYVASSAQLTQVVTAPVNHPPVAVNDSYTTLANTALTVSAPGVLSNDTDADGNTLTAIKVTNPAHGTVTLNANGSFTYTPATNYAGGDSFTYKANDGTADSNVATVSIAVKYTFSGFFGSVLNPPTVNQVNAGSNIAFVFGLGGNVGLNIFASGYPQSQQINCTTFVTIGTAQQSTAAMALSYSPTTGRYTYTAKTDKKWAGSCRQFNVRTVDGTDHFARFKFK